MTIQHLTEFMTGATCIVVAVIFFLGALAGFRDRRGEDIGRTDAWVCLTVGAILLGTGLWAIMTVWVTG